MGGCKNQTLALTPMMAEDDETGQALVEEERELTEKEKEIARLRAAEKFLMRDTGDALCSACGYKYQMAEGVQDRAYPAQLDVPQLQGAQGLLHARPDRDRGLRGEPGVRHWREHVDRGAEVQRYLWRSGSALRAVYCRLRSQLMHRAVSCLIPH